MVKIFLKFVALQTNSFTPQMGSLFKNGILILIIFSLLNLSLKIAVIQFEYTFKNKAFIEKYCENKNKPELKCNGKCHLAKIAKETQKENSEKQSFFDIEITFFQNIEKDFIFFNPYLSLKKIYWNYLNFYSLTTFSEFDHPPQFSF